MEGEKTFGFDPGIRICSKREIAQVGRNDRETRVVPREKGGKERERERKEHGSPSIFSLLGEQTELLLRFFSFFPRSRSAASRSPLSLLGPWGIIVIMII